MPYIPTQEEYLRRLTAQDEKWAKDQATEMGLFDPTKVVLNRAEYNGIYVDQETGIRFTPGKPVEVGKVHADRLLALRKGRLFSPAN
jgi:hypothetical protein